jgi:Polysaccharide lyase
MAALPLAGCNLILTDYATSEAGGAGGGTGAAGAGGEAGGGGGHIRANLLFEADFEAVSAFADFSKQKSRVGVSVTKSAEQARTGEYSFRAEVNSDSAFEFGGYTAQIVPSDDADPLDRGNRWYGWSMFFEAPSAAEEWAGTSAGSFMSWSSSDGGESVMALAADNAQWDVFVEATGSQGPNSPITADEWHDVVFHIDWDTGLLEFWLDGVQEIGLGGLTLGDRYLKLGLSQYDQPTETWVVYYDDLRIADENAIYADVAP